MPYKSTYIETNVIKTHVAFYKSLCKNAWFYYLNVFLIFYFLDFRGPLLTTNASFPLVANSVVSFTCKVEQTLRKMKFQWECLGNDTRTVRMSTKHASVIKRIAYLRFDNQMCKCRVNLDGYIAVASIKIKISSK